MIDQILPTYPLVIGTVTLKTTILAWNFDETCTGFCGSQRILPTDIFCISIPDNVTVTWSPAKATAFGVSSMERDLTVASSLFGHTSTRSPVLIVPVSTLPDTQKPVPVP